MENEAQTPAESQPKAKPQLRKEFLDYHAVGMVKRLQKAGHLAYLVGGCVRDLLVEQVPKDFDIGTSALPKEVKKLLSFAFIIGKRFRLVLVKRDDRQYEVATFRREPDKEEFPEGIPFGDNIFGTPEQDAFRRDFTCNAIFYDPVKDELIDYVDGLKDIDAHIIRMIGDPQTRLAEDPIRMLRALRFSHKLHFKIESELRQKMQEHAETLKLSALPRRREEYLKLLRLHDPVAVFREGYDLDLWKNTLPDLHRIYEKDEHLDIFEEKLGRLESRLYNPQDNALLAGAFILAQQRSLEKNWSQAHDVLSFTNADAEKIDEFAKKDLGLFNWEWDRIHKAMALQRTLAEPDVYMKKGQRRREGLLFSEAFPLAVDLAFIDAVLAPDVLEFWDTQLALTEGRYAK